MPCGTPPAVATPVDVLDLTGDPATATQVSTALTAAGYTVGQVTSSAPVTGTPADSALEYPTALLAPATALADVLHTSTVLREAQVENLTLVLTPADPEHLLAAVTALPAVCAPATPTP